MVAALVGGDIAWIVWLELVDGDGLAQALVARLVERREPVCGCDLVGRICALSAGRGARRRAGLRAAGGHMPGTGPQAGMGRSWKRPAL